MSKLSELLGQLEAAMADFQARIGQAEAEVQDNRAKHIRALQAFDAATVAGDGNALAEAQELIKALDADHGLLMRKMQILQRTLDRGEGPLQELCLQIKAEAEVEARARHDKWDSTYAELQATAQKYLELVAEMGKLNNASPPTGWEFVKNYLPRGAAVLEGWSLPSHVHETERGPIYQLPPATITSTFRKGAM